MAFGKNGGYRAITLDGDIFDPKGSVMGGYNESRMFFQNAAQIQDGKKKMHALAKDLTSIKTVTEELARRENARREKEGLRAVCKRKLELMEEEEKAKEAGSFEQQIKRTKEELEAESESITHLRQQIEREELEAEGLRKATQDAASGVRFGFSHDLDGVDRRCAGQGG